MNETRRQLLDDLARSLDYPDETTAERAKELWDRLDEVSTEAGETFGSFAAFVDGADTRELEELYVRTFDLDPACALELGWPLFGENYSRGAFMVRMRALLRDLGLSEGTELPDHLTNILPILGRLNDEEAETFATAFFMPGLYKMLENLEKKAAENPYNAILDTVRLLFCAWFPEAADSREIPKMREQLPYTPTGCGTGCGSGGGSAPSCVPGLQQDNATTSRGGSHV